MDKINALLKDPKYHTILSILKGARNGAVYGARIRFPHALVMTFLFRSGSFIDKMKLVLNLTYQHSRNLLCFVFLYKSMMAVLRWTRGGEENVHSFLAGIFGGYIVFGKQNTVNNQMILYLLSRVIVGLAKLTVKRGYISQPPNAFPITAALVWGFVMWLFRHDADVLQGSLRGSMVYLYNDSDKWDSLRNWIWHNK